MSELPKNNPDNTSRKSNRTLIYVVVGLAVLLVAAIVINIVRENNLKERDRELMVAYDRLDSIGTELNDKIVEIRRLGGNVEELEQARQQLEQEKEQLKDASVRTDKQLRAFRNRLEGYKELLVMKDAEIAELKTINEELLSENTVLKTEKNELNQTLQEAQITQEKLSEKVQLASRLEAENIKVAAVTDKGKEREDEFRARQIDKLKVEFNIAKNDVAPVQGKEILMRIIDDNDNVLFDVARGSGTFMLDGKETFYTAKQEILFDNSQQKVSFVYDKGSEYAEGRYTMEIYTDSYLMGSKSFRVK
jgi:cell division protein ZapB